MAKIINNRLAKLFEDFVSPTEWPHKYDNGVWRLGILMTDKKLVQVRFTFNSSGDSYEFGAPLAKVDLEKQSKFSLNVLTSKPMRGVTERLIGEKFFVLGSRDGLKYLPDEEIKRLFKNDVARISEYYEKLDKLLVVDVPDEDNEDLSRDEQLQVPLVQDILRRLFVRN